jgi:hypothetical protein
MAIVSYYFNLTSTVTLQVVVSIFVPSGLVSVLFEHLISPFAPLPALTHSNSTALKVLI